MFEFYTLSPAQLRRRCKNSFYLGWNLDFKKKYIKMKMIINIENESLCLKPMLING